MAYEEVKYWNEDRLRIFGRLTASIELEEEKANFLVEHIKDCKLILDYGVGFGRCFPYYSGKNVIGYDIADYGLYIKEVYAKYLNFSYIHEVEKEIKRLKYSDKFFDAVICFEVLLHQREQNIDFVMKELARVGKKVVVNSFESKEHIDMAEHNFNYDYRQLCERNGLKILSYCNTNNQSYFVYTS